MPSVGQCETASRSIAALSSLEVFDKFKAVNESGKDSDSEESFHLPLDDDDMENQSAMSNSKDKEIQNEETEEDILNKFETVPSGTPENIDPHIEESILNDVDNLPDKEVDEIAQDNETPSNKGTEELKETSLTVCPKSNDDNSKTKNDIAPVIEGKGGDEEKARCQNDCHSKTVVKLSYDFGQYEDSGDGEFKSVYETDENLHSEIVDTAKTVEPMEIAEESESVDCPISEVEKSQHIQKSSTISNGPVDTFEDTMEVEQDDTNQDIANIIEKLEDQDTPMKDVEFTTDMNDEEDINMAESCEEAELTSGDIKNTKEVEDSDKNIPVKDAQAEAVEGSDDVEMILDAQKNEDNQETYEENVDQIGSNKSANVTATIQEPLKEKSKDTTEADTTEQSVVNNEEKLSDNEIQLSEIKENIVISEDNEKLVDESIENERTAENREKLCEDNKKETTLNLENSILEDGDKTGSTEEKILCSKLDLSEKSGEVAVDELKSENTKEGDRTGSGVNDLNGDDLLKELDETIKEPEKEVQSEKENVENKKADILVESKADSPDKFETDKTDKTENKESEKALNTDEEVFKVPEEVCKISEAPAAQTEEKEGPDLQSDKSNDKTDEDESELLDVSMIRETEEDDACAIADALNDNEAHTSDKSDEEQSEKVETEQEGSDNDKDNDNDNEPFGFDDTDEDSRTEGMEHDDTSNADSVKDKVISESESESETKKRKKSIESISTDVSCDGIAAETSAAEDTEQTEKMDVSDSLAAETSLNLDSTLVQNETDPNSEQDATVLPVPTEGATVEKVEETQSKTDKDSDNAKESPVVERKSVDDSLPEKTPEDKSGKRKSSQNKRALPGGDAESAEIAAKKPKLASNDDAAKTQNEKEPVEKTDVSSKKTVEKDSTNDTLTTNEKVKTLTGFSKFMQCRKFTAKLSRSDLEQFCIQKICESLMLKSSEGELHQTIKKHEKTIDTLRKDLQQLTKQCKDLEIVNKKLMNELRNQNVQKKPLVPLKITRSVGLQVRLNPGNETPNQNRRRQINNTTPQKQVVTNTNPTPTRMKVTTGNVQQPAAARQVLQNTAQKSPLTTGQTTTNTATPTNPLLSQALQQAKSRPAQAVAAKRTAAPARKAAEPAKPANPGVIDLTDEDDKLAATKTVPGIKIINKTVPASGTTTKTVIGKIVPGKTVTNNQGKQVGVQKTVAVGNKGNTLSQGIRLTPTSVITSSSNGSPQMVYVVPTITSNSGGTQKVAFVNFQPTNGVLSGALNGSTVSVMSNKGQTLTLKQVPSPLRNKHPAPLPAPPRINLDPKLKPLLPKPHLTIKKIDTGIILQWKMPYNLDVYESIASYQLYAYQETNSPPSTDMWRKVGDVKALALPMACTLTQFADKNKYYFAVRSVDVHKRIGAFSDPEEISL